MIKFRGKLKSHPKVKEKVKAPKGKKTSKVPKGEKAGKIKGKVAAGVAGGALAGLGLNSIKGKIDDLINGGKKAEVEQGKRKENLANQPLEDDAATIAQNGLQDVVDKKLESEQNQAQAEKAEATQEEEQQKKLLDEVSKRDKHVSDILNKYGLKSSLLNDKDDVAFKSGIPTDYLSPGQIKRRYERKTQDPRLGIIMELLAAHNELIGQISFNLGVLARQNAIEAAVNKISASYLENKIAKAINQRDSINSDAQRNSARKANEQQASVIVKAAEKIQDPDEEAKEKPRYKTALGIITALGIGVPLVSSLLGSVLENFTNDSKEEDNKDESDDSLMAKAVGQTSDTLKTMQDAVSKREPKEAQEPKETPRGVGHSSAKTVVKPTRTPVKIESSHISSPTRTEKIEVSKAETEKPSTNKEKPAKKVVIKEVPLVKHENFAPSNTQHTVIETAEEPKPTKYSLGGLIAKVANFFKSKKDKPQDVGFNKPTDTEGSRPTDGTEKPHEDKEVKIDQEKVNNLHSVVTSQPKDGKEELVQVPQDIKISEKGTTAAIEELVKQVNKLRKEIFQNTMDLRHSIPFGEDGKGVYQLMQDTLDTTDSNQDSDTDEDTMSEDFDMGVDSSQVIPAQGKFPASVQGQKDFVRAVYPRVRNELKKQGIDTRWASIVVAQQASESAYGSKPVGNYNYGNFVVSNSKTQTGRHASDGNTYRNFNNIDEYVAYAVDRLNKKFNAFAGTPSVESFSRNIRANGYYTDTESHYTSLMRGVVPRVERYVADNGGVYVTPQMARTSVVPESKAKQINGGEVKVENIRPTVQAKPSQKVIAIQGRKVNNRFVRQNNQVIIKKGDTTIVDARPVYNIYNENNHYV